MKLVKMAGVAVLALTTVLPAFAGGSKEAGAGAQAGSGKKLVYVFVKNRGDLSYWDSIASGGDRAAKELADKADVKVVETTADIQANLTAMYEAADAKADLIISGSDFKDNLSEVAREFPGIGFVSIGEVDPVNDSPGNVYGIDFRSGEAAFLAGVAAADVASQGLSGTGKSRTVGFIGGMDETVVIQEFFIGFIQGAKYYDSATKVVYNYVGGWGDPDTARTQALAQYNDAKADVIFACAGGSGNGVHTAAAEVGKYVIGVDSDQSLQYRNDAKIQSRFVTSVLKLCNNAVYNAIDSYLRDGKLPYGVYQILGVKEDTVGIVENDLFNQYVSETGKAKIAAAKADISSGAVKVETALGKDQPTIKALIAELTK